MLYPDLRRLALADACPTGMPGTNQAESGGSNDPLPPPRSLARPGEGGEAPATAQAEALASQDILHSILLGLVDGDFADVCRAAARWCSLNKAHLAACDDWVWEELTRVVFPEARAPNTGRAGQTDEPTRPKDWFFHLCTQHKQYGDLLKERIKLASQRTRGTDDASKQYALLAARYARASFNRELLRAILANPTPPYLPDAIHLQLVRDVGHLENEMLRIGLEMQQARRRGAAPILPGRARAVGEEDKRLLRAILLQKAYLKDLTTDPEVRGPPTVGDELRRRRRLKTKVEQDRDLANLAQRAEAERKRQERQERHDLAEQSRAWLVALNQMNPREAALSRLIGEADQLIRRGFAEVTARGSTAKMKRIIARIAKERRARHTFASHPDLMGRLEGELARDVRFIQMAMNIPATEHASDETVTVYDLFGSEGEDEE